MAETLFYGVTPLRHTKKCKVLDTQDFKCPFCGSTMECHRGGPTDEVRPYVDNHDLYCQVLGMGIPPEMTWRNDCECRLVCPHCEATISNIGFTTVYYGERPKSLDCPRFTRPGRDEVALALGKRGGYQ